MKTLVKFFALVTIALLVTTNLNAQGISINETEAPAHSSAMLDVTSTSKGLLIPRMTSEQKQGIATPADGLMVFDTDTQSFWYFNSTAWTEVGAALSLKDSDGDTKIDVEKTADDDNIRFSTAGSERLKIDATGNILIGNETDYTQIDPDGTLTLHGEATVFEDLLVPVTSTTRGGSNDPAFLVYKTNGAGSQGVFTYWFSSSSEQELYFVVQMPHAWKEGSDIFPHVHWLVTSDLGANNVEWALEYTWVNIGNTFGNTSIISAYTPIAPVLPVTANKHVLTELPPMTGAGNTISSMLLCRVFRKVSSPNDTYPSSAALLQIDFHYEIDALGSRSEYAK